MADADADVVNGRHNSMVNPSCIHTRCQSVSCVSAACLTLRCPLMLTASLPATKSLCQCARRSPPHPHNTPTHRPLPADFLMFITPNPHRPLPADFLMFSEHHLGDDLDPRLLLKCSSAENIFPLSSCLSRRGRVVARPARWSWRGRTRRIPSSRLTASTGPNRWLGTNCCQAASAKAAMLARAFPPAAGQGLVWPWHSGKTLHLLQVYCAAPIAVFCPLVASWRAGFGLRLCKHARTGHASAARLCQHCWVAAYDG